MDKVRVLLIGIGGYGENYLKAMFPQPINDKCTLSAIADPFIENSAFYPEIMSSKIPVFPSPKDAFESGLSFDLAVISSPIHTHFEYINLCFDYGVNVLCEKPVTVSIERMEELIKREKETGLFCAVGYQLCFAHDVQEVKKDIISGLYGAPIRFKALRMMRRGDRYYSRTGWAGKLSSSGELILDSPMSNACAHQIQVMLYLLGKTYNSTARITSVEGRLEKARVDIENFDAAAIKISTDQGVPLYYYTAHCLDEAKVGPFIHLEFENGFIDSEDDNFVAYFKNGEVKDYTQIDKGDRMEKLIVAVDAVLNHERPKVTLETSLEHIRAVLLASKLPVYLRWDAEKRTAENGDGYFAIPGLREHYIALYGEWKTE